MRSSNNEESIRVSPPAEECRALAQGMQGEKRKQLIAMAATWEKIARTGVTVKSVTFPNTRTALVRFQTDEKGLNMFAPKTLVRR